MSWVSKDEECVEQRGGVAGWETGTGRGTDAENQMTLRELQEVPRWWPEKHERRDTDEMRGGGHDEATRGLVCKGCCRPWP